MGLRDIVQRILIKGDSKGAQKAAEDFEKKMTKAGVKAGVALKGIETAFKLVSGQMKAGLDDITEYDKAVNVLNVSMRKFGEQGKKHAELIQLQAKNMQTATGVSEQMVLKLGAQASAFGVATEKIKPLIEASIRLSNVTGGRISVDSAFVNLTKTMGGMLGELGEMLPSLKSLSREEINLENVVGLVNDKFTDQLDVLTGGAGGGVLGLLNTWEDTRREATRFAIETLKISDALSAVTNRMIVMTELKKQGFNFFSLLGVAFDPTNFDQINRMAKTIRENQEQQARNLQAEIELERIKEGRIARGVQTFGEGEGTEIAVNLKDIQAREKKRQKAIIAARKRVKAQLVSDTKLMDEFGQSGGTIAGEEQRAQAILDLEQRIADGKEEIRQSNHAREVHVTNAEFSLRRKNMEAELAMRQMVAQKGAAVALDAVFAIAEGEKVSIAEILSGFLKSTGRQLIADGVSGLIRSQIRNADPLAPGSGALMTAASLKAIAVGTAMAAGGFALGAGASSGGGGGGGGVGGRASATGGGGIGRGTSGAVSGGGMSTAGLSASGGGGAQGFGLSALASSQGSAQGKFGLGTAAGFFVNPIGAQVGLARRGLEAIGIGGGPSFGSRGELIERKRGAKRALRAFGVDPRDSRFQGLFSKERVRDVDALASGARFHERFGAGGNTNQRDIVIRINGAMSPSEVGQWATKGIEAMEREGR